jgi:coatomer subunit beta
METGVIFGSILWEGPNMSEACAIFNDVRIDIMDYIKPAYCNEAQVIAFWVFRPTFLLYLYSPFPA